MAVQHAPRHTIPAFGKTSDDDLHVVTIVRRQEARDIFNKDPSRPYRADQPNEIEPESASLSSQASTLSRHREVGTGESPDDEGDSLKSIEVCLGDVFISPYLWPMPFQDGASVLVNLDLPTDIPSRPFKAEVSAAGQMPAKQDPNVSLLAGIG